MALISARDYLNKGSEPTPSLESSPGGAGLTSASEYLNRKKGKQEDRMMADATEQFQVGQQFPEVVQSPDVGDTRFRQEQNDAEALQQQRLQDTDSAFRKEQRLTLPGRDIPVIGKLLSAADWVASNPVSEAIAEYTVPDQPMIQRRSEGDPLFRDNVNKPGTNAREQFLENAGQEEATGISKFVGQAAAPFFVPGAGLGAGSVYRPAAEVLTSRIPQGLGQNIAREAAIGAPLGFGYEYAQGEGNLGNAAMYGAAGAVLGGALPIAGRGIQAASAAAGRDLTQAVDKPALGTAVQDFMKRVNAPKSSVVPASEAITTNVSRVANTALNQAEDSFRRIESPTTGRVEPKNTYYADRLEELFTAAKQEQLPPGREREALEDIWSRMAGPQDPALDQLIELGTPTLKQLERRTPAPDMLSRARTQQASKETAGVPLPVKSEFDRGLKFNRGSAASEPPKLTPLRETPQPQQGKPMPEPILKSSPEPNEVVDDLITTKEPRLRDKVYNLLDEQEKAARARLDAKRGRLSSMPIDQWADHAVVLAAQIGKGGIKAADATEYMVKEFGEAIRPHVNEILGKARRIAQDTERRATKEAQEARAFNDADLGDSSTFGNKISRDVKKDKTPFSEKVEKLRTTFTDDLAPLEGLEKGVRGKVNSAESSLYKSARLYRGAPAKANQIVVDRLSPVIKEVENAGYTSKELGDYALAVHAKDVNARDIKSGFTNKEIESVIQKYGTTEMEAARKSLIKIGDDMLEELSDAGVISRDMMTTLRERYPNYIPLFRTMDDAKVEFGRGVSDSLANVSSPIKALKGSERNVVDPLENMVKNIYQSVNAAERNKVAQQLATLAKEDIDQTFIRKLDKNEEVGRKNVVSVMEEGQKIQYEVDPEVYKALLSLDKESSNMLIKILQKPASLLRAGATLTPEFSLRNPMRDVIQAFIVSKSGFNPITDFPAGLFETITKGKLYKQWVNEMGDFGNIMSVDRNTTNEALKKVLGEPPSKKFVNIVNGKSLIGLLRAIADTTESATKVGEFKAALRKGQTPQEAAYRSRDIMDFGRAGTGIRQANKIVAFLNANIQGKSKLIRAWREDKVGVTTRAFVGVTLPTIGVYLMQKKMANEAQTKTIEETPDWMKNSFWLVPVPGTDQVARIPKPFDLAAIFSNAPERALKYIYDNDKEAFDKFASQSLSESALPNQISGLLPFIEGMAGYSFFRQGDIVPLGEQGREFKDQYGIDTTETAKLLAAGANKLTGGEGSFKNFSSPRVMDNTVKGLTAGLGTYATSAIDVLLDGVGATDNPKRPEKGIAQQPLARAFLVNPLQSGKSTEQLYNLKEKLSKEKASANVNETDFDPEKEMKLKYINKQTKYMGEMTKEIRATENDRTLSPAQKRKIIDDLTRERNQMSKDAVQELKEW